MAVADQAEKAGGSSERGVRRSRLPCGAVSAQGDPSFAFECKEAQVPRTVEGKRMNLGRRKAGPDSLDRAASPARLHLQATPAKCKLRREVKGRDCDRPSFPSPALRRVAYPKCSGRVGEHSFKRGQAISRKLVRPSASGFPSFPVRCSSSALSQSQNSMSLWQ
jgi:hypothetical protein